MAPRTFESLVPLSRHPSHLRLFPPLLPAPQAEEELPDIDMDDKENPLAVTEARTAPTPRLPLTLPICPS